jgi:hypothetical protein
MQKLKHGLQIAAVGSLVAAAGARLVLQYRASAGPDPSSGRVEPVNLAPRISDGWDYVTSSDMLIYGGLLAAFLLAFLAWGAVSLVDGWRTAEDHGAPLERQVPNPPGAEMAARSSRWRRLSFGRRMHRPIGQVDHSA